MAIDIDPYVVVNALGGLDNPNADHAPAAGVHTGAQIGIDARTLADARASGVTAINVTIGYSLGDFPPFAHTMSEIGVWDEILRDHAADLMPVRTAADILEAKRRGRIGIIYGFQNGACLGDELDRVDLFAGMGVRVFQLTYNPANQIGDGSMAPDNRGLTPFGREVVQRLNAARVMVDLSHSGERTCLEAARLSRAPVSINHTGCRALVDLPRNKTDEELRAVASRGGFVGIYFMPFLDPAGQARASDVVAHIRHAVDVCGEDHVGIGTDGLITTIDDLDAHREVLAREVDERRAAGVAATGEGVGVLPFVVDLRGVDQFRKLAELLDREGFSSARIERILGRNFCDYARAVWGG